MGSAVPFVAGGEMYAGPISVCCDNDEKGNQELILPFVLSSVRVHVCIVWTFTNAVLRGSAEIGNWSSTGVIDVCILSLQFETTVHCSTHWNFNTRVLRTVWAKYSNTFM